MRWLSEESACCANLVACVWAPEHTYNARKERIPRVWCLHTPWHVCTAVPCTQSINKVHLKILSVDTREGYKTGHSLWTLCQPLCWRDNVEHMTSSAFTSTPLEGSEATLFVTPWKEVVFLLDSRKFFNFTNFFCICLFVQHMCGHASVLWKGRRTDNLLELVPSYAGLRDWTQVTRHGCKCLYALRHLASSDSFYYQHSVIFF